MKSSTPKGNMCTNVTSQLLSLHSHKQRGICVLALQGQSWCVREVIPLHNTSPSVLPAPLLSSPAWRQRKHQLKELPGEIK